MNLNQVVAEKNGSMSLDLFPVWCQHFVDNLPKDQGRGGLPVFLFLDGHASRWSFEALRLLMANNVWCFCLPSHTSIWSQVRLMSDPLILAPAHVSSLSTFCLCVSAWVH